MGEGTRFDGEVVALHLAPRGGEPMVACDVVTLLSGVGVRDDRYAIGDGTYSEKAGPWRQVTLVEAEALEAVAREQGITLSFADTRRNIGTRGVPLNHLVGREFTVGGARLRGIKLCEPCGSLQQRLGIDRLVQMLTHRAGLNAEVLDGGEIRVGDPIRPA